MAHINSKDNPDVFSVSAFDKIISAHVQTLNGLQIKIKDNLLHCVDDFAMKTPQGSVVFAQDGYLHNINGPALIWKSRDQMSGLFVRPSRGAAMFRHHELDPLEDFKAYFKENLLHRPALANQKQPPAVTYENGQQEWWVNGQRHRPQDEGPAIIYKDGSCQYWNNGKLHRTKGPAVIHKKLDKEEFWENGKFITAITYRDNCRIYSDQENRLHRENGPAIEPINAQMSPQNTYSWYIHGQETPSYDFKINQTSNGWVEHPWGSYHWKDGVLHSADEKPALVRHDTGLKIWYKDGLMHRTGKPAWEDPNSRIPERWFENGEEYNKTPLINAFSGSNQKVKIR